MAQISITDGQTPLHKTTPLLKRRFAADE